MSVKKTITFDMGKEDIARRRAAQVGRNYNQTKDTETRWAEREQEIVRFARSLGVDLDCEKERSQNARLLR